MRAESPLRSLLASRLPACGVASAGSSNQVRSNTQGGRLERTINTCSPEWDIGTGAQEDANRRTRGASLAGKCRGSGGRTKSRLYRRPTLLANRLEHKLGLLVGPVR